MNSFAVRPLLTLALCAGAAAFCCAPFRVMAQPMMPSGGAPGADGDAGLSTSEVIKTVGIDQKLDAQISPDLTFTDEAGRTVRLGDYFGKRPLLLSLVYYECPGLCTMTLNGVVSSLRPLTFTPGTEFDILTISFDPRETHELAAKKKERYIRDLKRPGAENGWHFLTGDEANIKALTETVGFRYRFDERTKQYAHGSAIMVLTPKGRVSRYFYGLEYSSRDLRLGLVEAADERIGTLTDAVTLLCYKYDPASGKYKFVMWTVRWAAVGTVLAIGTFLFVMLRRERRNRSIAPSAPNAAPAAGHG